MSQVVHAIHYCLSSSNIIFLFLKDEYSLLCEKCKYEYWEKGVLYSPDSVCSDGVWFYSGEESDVNGLYCCTACIEWFQKYTRGLFQDGTKRKWRRLTHREVCVHSYGQWIESQERTEKFVLHFKKKETEIKPYIPLYLYKYQFSLFIWKLVVTGICDCSTYFGECGVV